MPQKRVLIKNSYLVFIEMEVYEKEFECVMEHEREREKGYWCKRESYCAGVCVWNWNKGWNGAANFVQTMTD